MSQTRILVVEDDAPIRRGVADALTFAGYELLEAEDGDTGLRMAIEREVDLVLLDLMLPGIGGLEVLQEIRRTSPTMPVIILTARGEENDRINGLKLGADDYCVKPFGVEELLARVEAVLRRSPGRPGDIDRFEFPGGLVDFDRCEIRYDDGERADVSEKEAELLRYLVQHAGRAIARDELLSNVWRITPKGLSTRTIDMHIARLRDKLRDNIGSPRVLLTVRGKGYMFAIPNDSNA